MKHTWVKISEPIDFKALSWSFKCCRWKYWNGFPTEEYLKDSVAHSKADLQPLKGTKQIRRSGGISVEWKGDELSILLDSRIAEHYITHGAWQVTPYDPIPSRQ